MSEWNVVIWSCSLNLTVNHWRKCDIVDNSTISRWAVSPTLWLVYALLPLVRPPWSRISACKLYKCFTIPERMDKGTWFICLLGKLWINEWWKYCRNILQEWSWDWWIGCGCLLPAICLILKMELKGQKLSVETY